MTISMPRGDLRTICFNVTAQDSKSEIDFTEIYVTFKKSFKHKNVLFQKKLGNNTVEKTEDGYTFTIFPEDTNNLDYGKYVFDIELIYEDTLKTTFVGELIITNEVTFECNEG